MKKEYKINYYNLFFYFIIVFLIYTYFVSRGLDLSYKIFFAVFLFATYYLYFLKKLCASILFKENSIQIVVLIFFKKTTYDIEFIDFSYSFKEELVGRGTKGYKLRLYDKKSMILSLDSRISGWSDEQLGEIVDQFKLNNIEVYA